MTDLHDLSALEQALAIRRGECSSAELVAHYLDRIDRHGEAVGAFVTVTAERALDRARALPRRDDEEATLYGVPTAVKDLNATAGIRTTYGSAAFVDDVADHDDHVVTRMSQAGLISLGKTNTPEFGLPCYTEPDVAPPARTPWDRTRSAGGSSGGAAAAVAAGLLPVAQGSDGGGSIRIPASVCGLVGLKVSRGRVSAGPLAGDISGLAASGPLARTVADAAALLDVIAGPMPGDPTQAPSLPPGETFLVAARRPPGRLRIGRYRTPVIADTSVDPECLHAWEAASTLLSELGHEVEDVEPPFGPDVVPQFEVVWAVSAAAFPLTPVQEGQLRPLTTWLRQRGNRHSAVEWVSALSHMQLAARRARERSDAYDAILTPTLAQLPAPIGALRDDRDPAADFEAQKRFTPFTAVYNVTGQPAISLPLHWTATGLPVGVQLAGRYGEEATLLSLAGQLEQARPWRSRRPDIWAA